MNWFVFLGVFLMLFAQDCKNANQLEAANNSAAAQNRTAVDSTSTMNNSKTAAILGDIEYKIELKIIGNSPAAENTMPRLSVKYTVKNNGKTDYLLFNRGNSDKGFTKEIVYVEPQPDGSVEIGQRNYSQPKDKSCPKRNVPLKIGAVRLKQGETVTEELNIGLPLKYNPLFRNCFPLPDFPETVKRARFCLGIIKADAQRFKADSQGTVRVDAGGAIAQQQLLCSETIELK